MKSKTCCLSRKLNRWYSFREVGQSDLVLCVCVCWGGGLEWEDACTDAFSKV